MGRVFRSPFWIVLASIAVACGVSGMYYYNSTHRPVYYTIVTPEDGPLLSDSMEGWIAGKAGTYDIHGYALESPDLYEILLLDNRFAGKNEYVRSTLKAQLVAGALEISITDEPASNDAEVHNSTEVYFILENKPGSVEVVLNGEKQTMVLEAGDQQITR